MSRLLLHPLREGGNLTRVAPGHWEPVQRPEQLTDIALAEAADRAKRGRISSVPSPWARLQLFRDAVLDARHPFHEEALNDILDALEVVLFQEYLAGVELEARVIDLRQVLESARGERVAGITRFADALLELAPTVDGTGRLEQVTVLFNQGRLLFATSPFTLVFTPETRLTQVPGYFTGDRPLRPLADRPPMLARYVRESLLPQINASPAGGVPEIQRLKVLLEEQLGDVAAGGGAAFVDAKIYVAPGIALQRLSADASLFESPLRLVPKRTLGPSTRTPLVIDDSGSPAQQRYFRWLDRPRGTQAAAAPRDVLPGTSWKFEWIHPERDLLAEKLIVLDAPLYSDRAYGAAGEGAPSTSDVANRVLLPLTRTFFEYFRAEDVPRMVTMRVAEVDGTIRAQVRLSVPTAGGTVTVEKEYSQHAHQPSHLSLWPGFVAEGPDARWHDYYLMHFAEGEDASQALDITFGVGGTTVEPQKFQRDFSTVVYHLAQPPECLFLRVPDVTVGDPRRAEGVILPRFRTPPAATQASWTVAIDFGTSSTVIAYREEGQKPQVLKVTEATRFDLTRHGTEQGHIETYFDTFFFPAALEGRPFGTLVLKSLGADVSSRLAGVPALTANVPFTGMVSGAGGGGARKNQVVGDLKWGGGGEDTERLTKLFLHQILQVVHAEARARGVRIDDVRIRWSYPSAFSPRRHDSTATQWETIVGDFHRDRLNRGDASAAGDLLRSLDESTAAMLYFKTDPAASRNFGQLSPYIKLTADVGGGTTDVAAYANNAIVFRNSVLFGGRDLIGEAEGTDRSIFTQLYGWAVRKGLPTPVKGVIDAYPSHHTKFTYLVRHPWFAGKQGTLSSESWFPQVQACILYFYGAIHYNIGLRLRGVTAGDVRPPDYLFFGGNGSSYLNWLTEFRPWNTSRTREGFTSLFQAMLEAGYGQPLGDTMTLLTSSNPKHEVALGLLTTDSYPAESGIPSSPPLGELVTLGGDAKEYAPEGALSGVVVSQRGLHNLRHVRPFDEWEISRFNKAFQASLAALGERVDPQWMSIAGRVESVFAPLKERFYVNQVLHALGDQLQADNQISVSLFITEAAATLRQLQHGLFNE